MRLFPVLELALCATASAGASGQLSVVHGYDAVHKDLTIRQTDASAPTCPGSNSTSYTSNGEAFIIECGIDRPGPSLAFNMTVTFSQCIDLCASETSCIDVTWSPDTNDCYSMDILHDPVADSSIWGARSSSVSDPKLTCPGNDGTNYTTANDHVFVVECGLDRPGGDLSTEQTPSLESCIELCVNTTACVDVSWVYGQPDGSCYMKSQQNTPNSNPSVWGARSLNSTGTVTSSSTSNQQAPPGAQEHPGSTAVNSTAGPAFTCPDSNGTLYSTYNNETFIIECYLDRPGNSANQQTVGLRECLDLCASTTGCADVSWVVQSATSGVCYMKNQILNGTTAQNVWGARWSNTTYLYMPPTKPVYAYATAAVTHPVAPAAFTDIPYTMIDEMQGDTFFDHFQFGTVGLKTPLLQLEPDASNRIMTPLSALSRMLVLLTPQKPSLT